MSFCCKQNHFSISFWQKSEQKQAKSEEKFSFCSQMSRKKANFAS